MAATPTTAAASSIAVAPASPFNLKAITDNVVWYNVLPPVPFPSPRNGGNHSQPFVVISYNILAYAYAESNLKTPSYNYLVPFVEAREARDHAVSELLLATKADIMCLQEVEENSTILKRLRKEGYQCEYTPRPKIGDTAKFVTPDTGIATCFHTKSFELRVIDDVPLYACQPKWPADTPLAERDCVNRLNNCGTVTLLDSVSHFPFSFSVCIGNIHAHWSPKRECVKEAQAAMVAKYMGHRTGTCAMIFAGDFNSTAGDSLTYKALTGPSSPFKSAYDFYRLYAQMDYAFKVIPGSRWVASAQQKHLQQAWSETRQLGEPVATNVTCNFAKTIDYIFYDPAMMKSGEEGLRIQKILKVPSIEKYRKEGEPATGIPDAENPSDHFPLGVEFVIFKA